MKESNFQTEFGKRNSHEGVFELKLCKGTSLPFSSVAEHQEEALVAASSERGLFHKISDSPFFPNKKMRFTKPKPFDCFCVKDYPAYVVIMWWVPRKEKNVYYISIDTWLGLKENAGRKSITEEMAQESSSFMESYLK